MRNLLATFLVLVGASAFGQSQGTAVRSNNGIATNLTHVGAQTNGPGATVVHLSSGSTAVGAGTLYSLLDTNGLFRMLIVGTNIFFRDTNTVQLRISPVGVEAQGAGFVGNGAGLTNLTGATNFNSSVTYNFNGKTTFNAVSYNTNAWAGPTNPIVLTTNYQFFVASTDCAITGVSGQLADQNTWATLTVSNSTASPITVRSTATGFRPQGASTSTALVIGAGKEGYLSFHSRGVLSTNLVTSTQQ